ncbi:S41 family peptidase [Loigolactobacillus coryniformis]|uniref:PDZ domain-containing protein n=1 Tax=Loigolactobacillus coryniformis TaxID=1610 RepID=A0A5B8THV6_9LACO|nr:S41 family peptidase [Loigolactobacillus coryniformis]QEA53810.1 PDZ domain-containing protein [Loigolactobacillus coryniformis]RRG07149.1 MAG: PDZ domain-containing protein [Lactobacillus sp.]
MILLKKAPKSESKVPKKRKRRVSLLVYISSTLLAFFVGIFMTILIVGLNSRTSQQLDTSSAGFSKISQVYQTISQQYYRKTDQKKLINGAIKGMVNSLDDPYSEYLTGSDASNLDNTISGSFEGIGAEIQKKGNYVEIVSPIAGSPAKKAGLKANDVITAINGHSTAGWSATKTTNKIRGKKGTKVTLTIKRDQQSFKITLKRDVIPVKTVNARIDKQHPTVGYIQITSFSEPTFKEVKTAIKKLRQEGAKSFILDVRSNPGGIMQQALKISSMFVANGKTLMQVKARTGQPTVYKAGKSQDGGFKVKEPVKVLIDDGSASASEIFAAALNQSANVELIGTKSFGKGTVQQVSQLDKKSEFKITVAKWLTPNGSWINKRGLTPNIEAKYPSYAYLPMVSDQKTYQLEDVSSKIKTLQTELKAVGQDPGTINGYFSTTTQKAVVAFQAANNLDQTGKLDTATIDKLQTEITKKISDNDVAYNKAVEQLTK